MDRHTDRHTDRQTNICHGTYGLHAGCPHHFSFKYNMRSLWQPHKLSLPTTPITDCNLALCKLQPPQLPFASALVMDWFQCYGCPPCMHVVPLYKRARPPSPWLTFWLNVTPVTLESRTDSSPGHSPDCWFTLHLLVNFSFCWQLTTVNPLTSRSLVIERKP